MQFSTVIKKVFHKGLVRQYKKQLHKQTISYEEYIRKLESSYIKELDKQTDYEEKEVQVLFYPEMDATFEVSGIRAEYLLFYPMDGKISDFAKKAVWCYFKEHPECDFLYGDEDSLDSDGKRKKPYFKPDWSPTEYTDSFYIYGVFAVRKSAVRETDFLHSGNWLKNLVHFCDENLKRLGGFDKCVNNEKIGHLPYVLFHRMNQNKRGKWQKLTVDCVPKQKNDDLVSVILLSKDNYSVVRANMETLMHHSKSMAFEVILVDNGSDNETRELLESYCKKKNILYIYEKCDFHFSYLCNLGAKAAKGNLLLFMNDDVEADEVNFMETMAKEARKPYVGAVGCKLLYPGTRKIQHAGITNLAIGPMHKLQYEKDNKEHYFGRNRKKINVIAVTAACLMIEKSKFEEVGGFSLEFPVAYNDVALGFALSKAGYYNACLNDVCLYHYESLTRGCDDSPQKVERLIKEQKKLYEMYPEFLGVDPFYSVRLANDISNRRMEMKLIASEESLKKAVRPKPEKKTYIPKENPSVFVTIEWILEENNGIIISGYTFVAGADNATFDREIWLVPVNCDETSQPIYKLPLNKCLRCDVAQNVPDQKNVELSGFSIEFDKADLPSGKYVVWVRQKERYGRLRLFKRSNRSIEIE